MSMRRKRYKPCRVTVTKTSVEYFFKKICISEFGGFSNDAHHAERWWLLWSEAKPRWTLHSSLRSLPYLLFKNLLFHSAAIPYHKIRCHSLIEFNRLRPFPVIHSLLAIIPCRFVACSSSIKFVTVRSSSNPNIPSRRAGQRKPSDFFEF